MVSTLRKVDPMQGVLTDADSFLASIFTTDTAVQEQNLSQMLDYMNAYRVLDIIPRLLHTVALMVVSAEIHRVSQDADASHPQRAYACHRWRIHSC